MNGLPVAAVPGGHNHAFSVAFNDSSVHYEVCVCLHVHVRFVNDCFNRYLQSVETLQTLIFSLTLVIKHSLCQFVKPFQAACIIICVQLNLILNYVLSMHSF